MADSPPSPSLTPAPGAEPVLPATPARGDGIQPAGANGAPPKPERKETAAAKPTVRFGQWLAAKGMHLGVLLGLWVVALLALKLYGLETPNALGFATVFALVAGFFVRSLLPAGVEKAVADTSKAPAAQADSFREVVETVVFVVVLVLLLKSFAAEAFVIPTGSMAETLWGYQKVVTCPQCGQKFPVNCSQEVDPSEGEPTNVLGCTCPNCRQHIVFFHPQKGPPRELPQGIQAIPDPGWNSGDRVLVAKFVYDLLQKLPNRLDVVVFKFPGDDGFPVKSGPVKKHVPMNYIKRLIGLPGETIAIYKGKLYLLSKEACERNRLVYDDVEKAAGDPNKLAQLWKYEYMHADDQLAKKVFEDKKGGFVIIRKKPDTLLAMMRLVYDNDHQAKDLSGPDFQRWQPVGEGGWAADGKTGFRHDGSGAEPSWLRYRHVLPTRDRGGVEKPQLITDFMGYNTWEGERGHSAPGENWASDLIVECQARVEKPDGVFVLELSRGPDRFQAKFDLKEGTCTLFRLVDGKEPEKLGSADSRMKGKGAYQVRFANVDDRLAVWVDGRLIFGDGVEYQGRRDLTPTRENDLERPVSIGAQGAAVAVSKLKVFRDTYYTTSRNKAPSTSDVPELKPEDPESFKHVAAAPVATFYVQPGHFLCLGDNSPESSDGRAWGLVPHRLMLGRALLVYYPFSRAGRIR
jgi:signal peptidase I